MLSLRADPWTPDRGMGFEARLDETPATADPDVETSDWSRPFSPGEHPDAPVWFVDGVRRIELRVLADDDGGRRAPGLFGSWAVGSVCCDGKAAFGEHDVGRSVVLGGGLKPDRIEIAVGSHTLVYEPRSETGTDPDTPLHGLQEAMRKAEASIATRLANADGCLVLADGPLKTLRDETTSPIVGVVKRFVRAYLDPEHDALLARLAPGERTPLFGLSYEGDPLERYAWYTRLVISPRTWHDHAGLVRCEVRAGVGLDRARELADRVSGMLPRYAGRATDPRYPQNLAPVGGLEAWLQHRMGNRLLIRRALTTWLSGEVAA
ncbi:MAG TPA: DNA double-strand break repair nuclease NurA [Actinomycetota bacterium]|nr:DNA double-strand break repair nuclease NurA [Actinomycetota bacterium]